MRLLLTGTKKCTVHEKPSKPSDKDSPLEECPYCADKECYDWHQHLLAARDTIDAKKFPKLPSGGTACLDARSLAGLSTTAGSEPSEQASEQDDVSDNETLSSSKLSGVRPNWQKGVSKVARNTFRAQKNKEDAGHIWVHHFRWRQLEIYTGLEGASAQAFQARALEEHEMDVLTLEEKMARVRIVNEECQEGRIEAESVIDERHIKVVHGERVCGFCNKRATETHISSAHHRLAVMEHAKIDDMIGETGSTRRFNRNNHGRLHTSLPTQENMYDLWGEGVDQLGFVARAKHKMTGTIFLEQGKKKKPSKLSSSKWASHAWESWHTTARASTTVTNSHGSTI